MNKLIIGFCLLLMGLGKLSAQDSYELLFLQGNFTQIEQLAEKRSTEDDFYWYAIVQEKSGNLNQAIRILEEGLDVFESDEKLELLLSEYYFESGNYPRAEKLLTKYSHLSQSFLQLIQLYEFRGNFNKAISLLNERIEKDTSNIHLLKHLGDNYYHLDSFEMALDYYQKVFSRDSSDQVTANKIANIFLQRKEYQKSIEICEFVLSTDSTNKKFIKLMGISLINKNDFKSAQSCFHKLYIAGDSNRFVLKNLGICELNTYSFYDARKHLMSAFTMDSNDIETCFCLGKAFLNSMWPEQGLYYFNRVDSLSQADPKILSAIHIEKEAIFSVLGKFDEALREYSMAYKLNPKPEYLFFIASLYQSKLEDKKKALEYYETFLTMLPELSESEHSHQEEQIVISLKKVAEDNIRSLKEEIFFDSE